MLFDQHQSIIKKANMEDKTRAVEVRATYWIGKQDAESSSGNNGVEPTRIQSFGTGSSEGNSKDGSHVVVDAPFRVGLPEGMKPEKRPAGDESYSGMHDQGPLPPLREGGSMALLLECVQQAKAFNDQYLTEVIASQKSSSATKTTHKQSSETENPIKKAKVESKE